MGIPIKADTLSAIGRTPAGEMERPGKSRIRGAQTNLRGGELEDMLGQPFEVRRGHVLPRLEPSDQSRTRSYRPGRQAGTCFRPLIASFIALTNRPGEALLPQGMTSHS